MSQSTTIPSTMRAILVPKFGPPSVFQYQDVPTPTPQAGQALIQIKAFGLNHAEMHMRRGEWAESMPIIGVECVGLIASCPDDSFAVGTPVAALMGGLGRTINGTYAQYTVAPTSNIVALGRDEREVFAKGQGLSWEVLGAMPETYATAWTALFRNLEIKKGQTLLVRGATSSMGRAAIKLAVQAGVEVTATSRKVERFDELLKLGVKRTLLEGSGLSERVKEEGLEKFDAVLELVGNSTVVDSLKLTRRGGRLCLAGWLGGLAPIAEFNPLLQMASGVHWSFFGSFVFGTEDFPVSDIPFHEIVQMMAEGKLSAEPSRVFGFEEIQEAHKVMEANAADGKMVIRVA